MSTYIDSIKDKDGNTVLPITNPKASYFDNGERLDNVVNDLTEGLNNVNDQISIVSNKLDSKNGFIDTSKILATLSPNTNWEATENCIVAGTVSIKSGAVVGIYIDKVQVGTISNNASSWIYVPINYNIAKGTNIKVNASTSDVTLTIKAYGFK